MTDDAAADAAPRAPPANIHATAVLLGDRGVVLLGRSGSGKTTLALALVARARAAGRHGALVSDDRLLVHAASGRLIVAAPKAIEGLAEIYGLGPRAVRFEPRTVVDLAVRLVPEADMPRMPEPESIELAGVGIASIPVSERNIAMAVPVVFSALGLAI